MHHFFVKPNQVENGQIRITGSDVNHGKNVLRIRPGEEILVSDGCGMDYICQVYSLDETSILAQITEKETKSRELPAFITLYQGLPKSDKMELIIQKAVELGVTRIVPVATKNAVVKLEGKREEGKIKRWQAIAESAAKQSKRSRIPQVSGVINLGQALQEGAVCESRLIAYEQEEGMAGTKRELLKISGGQRIAVLIGPEGGFDECEVQAAAKAGFCPVSLGKRILRTETAGLSLLSVIMMKLELMYWA
ncbi:MAG: 16S rRNA (uracil(1498)-N(3))-methyltransferase [Lachnospiraceae bacterium]|jgi:16S rRNA (uracil1498-N3)-methyltransferase|nr:16S rRNA (uracil(1498)-N(3))-methyltransferase [Lachnospiraceae bacterium]